MKYKAVCFDLFETLITEWGHKKYTKNEMCADLGIERDKFDRYWEAQEQERYMGSISYEDSLAYVCRKCAKPVDIATISKMLKIRKQTKADCFDFIKPEVLQLLDEIRKTGLPIVLISNCSFEEIDGLAKSKLYPYLDEIILSCEVQMKKPDACIYEEAAKRLGVKPSECIFVGDGGSNELQGARNVGMKAIQAKWYTNELPDQRADIDGFETAEVPQKVMEYLETDMVEMKLDEVVL